MRFVFSADFHLSGYAQDKIDRDTNLPERLSEIKTALFDMTDYCYKNHIYYFIIGGDILHNKSIIYTEAQSVMLNFIRSNRDLSFIVIDGNHDLSGKGNNVVSALESIDSEPNVTRLKEFKRIDNILLVPYSTTMVEEIKGNSEDYLVAHLGLNEAVLNSGISVVSEIGIKDLVGKYKVCLFGHYHSPQDIIKDNIKIYYVGSPTQKDWGEKHEEKRFLDIDSISNTIISIPTKGYKKFFELKLKKDNIQEVLEEAANLKKDGHYVKIRRLEEVDTSKIDKDFTIVDDVEKDITNRGISSTMSRSEKINKFLEIKKIPKDKIELYRNCALDIMESCVEMK